MQDYWEKREEAWDDYFAKSDAIRERYASEIEDMRHDDEAEREYYDYLYKVKEAGFETEEEYEAYWQRALARGEEYYQENA
tara:strand:+ start:131 stop:373 length:243 start_codon:yes stop_codon:yes gene_type:complete